MIRLEQTILGRGREFGEAAGDCFATCIAAIFELPREEVPNFCEDRENWWSKTNDWLAERGYFYVDILPQEEEREKVLSRLGWHVIVGDGPRGCKHAVVGYAGKMEHDPHPSGAGLLTVDFYGVFVALYPEGRPLDIVRAENLELKGRIANALL